MRILKSIIILCLFFYTFSVGASENIRESISKIAPTYDGARVINTGDNPFYLIVSDEEEKIYVTEDAEHVIVGKVFENYDDQLLIDLEDKVVSEHRSDIINQLNKNNFVLYKTKEQKKTDLLVFADISCPFCQRMHQHMDDILELGFDVYYIPYPRNGMQDKKTVRGLKKIVCSENPSQEYDKAFEAPEDYVANISNSETECDEADKIADYYQLGSIMGVEGTPATFLDNGFSILGFDSYRGFSAQLKSEYDKYELIKKLGND